MKPIQSCCPHGQSLLKKYHQHWPGRYGLRGSGKILSPWISPSIRIYFLRLLYLFCLNFRFEKSNTSSLRWTVSLFTSAHSIISLWDSRKNFLPCSPLSSWSTPVSYQLFASLLILIQLHQRTEYKSLMPLRLLDSVPSPCTPMFWNRTGVS